MDTTDFPLARRRTDPHWFVYLSTATLLTNALIQSKVRDDKIQIQKNAQNRTARACFSKEEMKEARLFRDFLHGLNIELSCNWVD